MKKEVTKHYPLEQDNITVVHVLKKKLHYE